MYKDTFRVLSKRILKHIPKQEKKQYAEEITTQLLLSEWWVRAEVIAITVAREIELDTMPIIEKAWKQDKTVVIPKCYPDEDNTMRFYQFTNKNELENVFLDLYEPKEDPKKLVSSQDIDLIIVPGLLFDYQGYRIGYGGGYYDRFLTSYNQDKISIAMELQLVKHVPHEVFDLPVDAVITEKNIYKNPDI
ncbi:5-formyltetrahydrofolate cyclo-ligase [Tenuibacillus multivorans]|nr:5-formyltetrahydrofolate cyclo-ligase [Tenuibacillus multivorans]